MSLDLEWFSIQKILSRRIKYSSSWCRKDRRQRKSLIISHNRTPWFSKYRHHCSIPRTQVFQHPNDSWTAILRGRYGYPRNSEESRQLILATQLIQQSMITWKSTWRQVSITPKDPTKRKGSGRWDETSSCVSDDVSPRLLFESNHFKKSRSNSYRIRGADRFTIRMFNPLDKYETDWLRRRERLSTRHDKYWESSYYKKIWGNTRSGTRQTLSWRTTHSYLNEIQTEKLTLDWLKRRMTFMDLTSKSELGEEAKDTTTRQDENYSKWDMYLRLLQESGWKKEELISFHHKCLRDVSENTSKRRKKNPRRRRRDWRKVKRRTQDKAVKEERMEDERRLRMFAARRRRRVSLDLTQRLPKKSRGIKKNVSITDDVSIVIIDVDSKENQKERRSWWIIHQHAHSASFLQNFKYTSNLYSFLFHHPHWFE